MSRGSEKLTAGNNSTVAPICSSRAFSPRACSTARVTTILFPCERSGMRSCRRPATFARPAMRRAPASAQFLGNLFADRFRRRPDLPNPSATSAACHPEKERRRQAASAPCSMRPHAPMGTWQPPPRPASAARSAVTALRVSASSNLARMPHVTASAARASMPIAPCPAAGD